MYTMMYQSNPRPEATTELMKSCVTLYKELLLLENFAVMNFCGISKVIAVFSCVAVVNHVNRALTICRLRLRFLDFEKA